MHLAEFLANVPPGVEEQIEGLFKRRELGLGLPRLHGLFAFKPRHLLSV